MKNIISFLLILTTTSLSVVVAQNTLRPNIYFQNMNFYNPADGISDTSAKREASVYLKDKIVPNDNEEVWEKPVNIYLNYLCNINSNSFYNVSYIYDGYSYYSRNTIYAGYTRIFHFSENTNLSTGGRAVFNFDNINWDKVDQTDDKSSSDMHLTPDLDLGVQFKWKKLTLGASSKNLLESNVEVDGEAIIQDWREFYLNASYTFGLFKKNLNISPFVLYLAERDVEFDAGINFNFLKDFDISYTLRTFELRSVIAAKVLLFERFQLGASVDMSSVFSDNNVDFIISYRF